MDGHSGGKAKVRARRLNVVRSNGGRVLRQRGDYVATYVLVHGAWHGAWCWQRVRRLLTARGHDVYAPTLTGVCERSHLFNPAIDLDTHIADVVNIIRWGGLEDVVLVGHSYGGLVISGVAEKVEKSISSFVMLDAFFPEDGQSLLDLSNELTRNAVEGAAAKGVAAIPPRAAEIFHVNNADVAWVDTQCTPQPIKTLTQKVALTGARERIAKKSYIRAASYPNEPFDAAREKARVAGWLVYDVACGHDVMLDEPQRLTEILIEVA
jgi:pimeloyl-ACP methyl ester carboxylesterase